MTGTNVIVVFKYIKTGQEKYKNHEIVIGSITFQIHMCTCAFFTKQNVLIADLRYCKRLIFADLFFVLFFLVSAL